MERQTIRQKWLKASQHSENAAKATDMVCEHSHAVHEAAQRLLAFADEINRQREKNPFEKITISVKEAYEINSLAVLATLASTGLDMNLVSLNSNLEAMALQLHELSDHVLNPPSRVKKKLALKPLAKTPSAIGKSTRKGAARKRSKSATKSRRPARS